MVSLLVLLFGFLVIPKVSLYVEMLKISFLLFPSHRKELDFL